MNNRPLLKSELLQC